MGRIQKAPNKVRNRGTVKPERKGRTEIREYGDRKTIVLYTTENEIYQALKDKADQKVFYEIWKDCDPAKAKRVAVDLYFPKEVKISLQKLIVQLQKSGGNCLKSKSCQKLLKAI
jgi:hypothetical protein